MGFVERNCRYVVGEAKNNYVLEWTDFISNYLNPLKQVVL